MAVLTTSELVALRRAVGEGVVPITWDKTTINTATQDAENVLEALGFDATRFVTEATTTNVRAQNVKAALAAGQIASNIVPVVEDWLLEHPPSVTLLSIGTAAITSFITANRTVLIAAVAGMPVGQQAKTIQAVIRRRVEAAV